MGAGEGSFPILAKKEIEDALLEARQNLRSRFVEHTRKMPERISENNGLLSYLFALFFHWRGHGHLGSLDRWCVQ
jgi:hypothetical protein